MEHIKELFILVSTLCVYVVIMDILNNLITLHRRAHELSMFMLVILFIGMATTSYVITINIMRIIITEMGM